MVGTEEWNHFECRIAHSQPFAYILCKKFAFVNVWVMIGILLMIMYEETLYSSIVSFLFRVRQVVKLSSQVFSHTFSQMVTYRKNAFTYLINLLTSLVLVSLPSTRLLPKANTILCDLLRNESLHQQPYGAYVNIHYECVCTDSRAFLSCCPTKFCNVNKRPSIQCDVKN